jgi:hypothetical protein
VFVYVGHVYRTDVDDDGNTYLYMHIYIYIYDYALMCTYIYENISPHICTGYCMYMNTCTMQLFISPMHYRMGDSPPQKKNPLGEEEQAKTLELGIYIYMYINVYVYIYMLMRGIYMCIFMYIYIYN